MLQKHEQSIKDFKGRREAKRFQQNYNRDIKAKDFEISNQNVINQASADLKDAISNYHTEGESFIAHTEARHIKQTKQRALAQERKIVDQKSIYLLQKLLNLL